LNLPQVYNAGGLPTIKIGGVITPICPPLTAR